MSINRDKGNQMSIRTDHHTQCPADNEQATRGNRPASEVIASGRLGVIRNGTFELCCWARD